MRAPTARRGAAPGPLWSWLGSHGLAQWVQKKQGSTARPACISPGCPCGSVFIDGLELVARTLAHVDIVIVWSVIVMVGYVLGAFSDGGILLHREETEVLGRND